MEDTRSATEAKKAVEQRPILAVADHPVDPDAILLDADSLATLPPDAIVEYTRTLRVSEAQGVALALEDVADDHNRRAGRARDAAQIVRGALHDAANAADRSTVAPGRG